MSEYGNTALQERIARRKRQARKTKMKKLSIVIAFLLAIVAIFFAVKGISSWIDAKKVAPMEFAFSTEPKTVSAAEPVIAYNKNYGTGMRYPNTGNADLDAVIKKDAEGLIEQFEKELGEYHAESMESRASIMMDYDAYKQGDQALSVVYRIQKNLPQDQKKEEKICTLVYNRKTVSAVTAQDIFKEDYLKIASDFVQQTLASNPEYQKKMDTEQFKTHIDPIWENFSAISFEEEDQVSLYFNNDTLFDEQVIVKLPLKKVFDTMKLNLTGYEPPKSLVDPTKPMVALTFDDGPYTPVTSRILDALEKVGGRATFFVLGERVDGSREVMKRAVEMGCEIGNHSYDHANLAKLNSDGITNQIQKTSNLVQQAVGKPTTLVRAPFGATNKTVRATVGGPLINWSIDTEDWKSRNPDKIVPMILNHVGDGDIILMHDIYKTSATAAERVIPELIKRGYQLVTISELMEAREVIMTAGKTYYEAYKK